MMRIGVIGYGYWGPNIVRNIMAQPGATVTWVCDINPHALASIPRQYPTIQITSNISDVFSDTNTDGVVIVTPPSTHFTLAKAAIANGKHVLVEKPLTQTSLQSKKLITLAKAKKKTLMVDHTFLYTPAVRKLKELINQNVFGRVFYVDSVRTNLGLFQKDSNVVADLAVHDFAIMDYLLGILPTHISATGIREEKLKQETVAHISTRYGNKLFLHSHVSWISPIKIRRMMIIGTKKMAVYDDIEPSEKLKIYDKSVSVTSDPKASYELRVGYRSGAASVPALQTEEALYGVIHEFLRSIQSGTLPRTDGAQGQLIVRCIEAATTSLRTNGKTIKL